MSDSIVENGDTPKEENLESLNSEVLLGDYKIETTLGKGSYGKVVQAVNKNNNDVQYALKYFDKKTVLQKNQLGKLKEEFNILVKLDSVFVTNLIEVFQTPHTLCFVMEACQPVNFYNIMTAHKCLDKCCATFFSAELFLGIKYLHQNKIIHQDIKLENLLITNSGHLKICDFGLSEHDDPEKKLSKSCGTLVYFSPEKVRKIEYTMKTDWWCFGIVVAEFCGCISPFDHGKSKRKETKTAIVNLRMEWTTRLPEDVQDLVKKLLRYEGQRLTQDEISRHQFFEKVNWEDYEEQRVPPCCTINPHNVDIRSHSIEAEDSGEIDNKNDDFDTFSYKRMPME